MHVTEYIKNYNQDIKMLKMYEITRKFKKGDQCCRYTVLAESAEDATLGFAIAAGANALIPIITANIAITGNAYFLFIVQLNKCLYKRTGKCYNKFLQFKL